MAQPSVANVAVYLSVAIMAGVRHPMSLLRFLCLAILLDAVTCPTDPTPTPTPSWSSQDATTTELATTTAAPEEYVVAYNDVLQNGTLAFAGDIVHELASRDADAATFQILIAVYAAILELNATESDATDDGDVGSAILRDMASVVRRMSLATDEDIVAEWSVLFKIIVQLLPPDAEFFKDFTGDLMHTAGGLEIRSMCLVTEWTFASLIVYPESRSPFRPLPEAAGFAIVNFTVFDVVLTKVKENIHEFVNTSCLQFYDMLDLRLTSENQPLGLRFGCAEWSVESAGWSTERCSLEPTLYNTGVKCYCDVKNGSRATEYIVYEYVEDAAWDFVYLPPAAGPEDARDVRRLEELEQMIRGLATEPTNSSSFELFVVDYLSSVLRFDADVIHSRQNGSTLEDIGTILAAAVPDDGSWLIGRGDGLVSAFVALTSTYPHQPLVAFILYADHASWMTYYRAGDKIDAQRAFSPDVEYTAILSASISHRNARHGLLVYPRDKFLAPVDQIDGHAVLASRVLDLVLVPFPDVQDVDDGGDGGGVSEQFLHIYFNAALDKNALTGCAYRSAITGNWTARGCRVNGDLFNHEVCTCSVTANLHVSRTRGQFVSYKYRTVDFDNADGGGAVYVHADFEKFTASVLSLRQLRSYHIGREVVDWEAKMLVNILYNPYGTIWLNAGMDDVIIGDAREILLLNNCLKLQTAAFGDSVGAVCVNSSEPDAKAHYVAFSYNRIMDSFGTTTFTRDDYHAAAVFSDEHSFAVHVSDSLRTQNARYAFLVYPVDVYLKPLPAIEHVLLSSRVVDVVLVPGYAAQAEEQFIEMYLDQTLYNSTQGCAYWSSALDDWTSAGCRLVRVNAFDVCNCSLSANFHQARSGGQYIVYTFSEAFFDDDVYLRLGSESLGDVVDIFAHGTALIHNASRLPADDAHVIKVLQTFVRVLSVDDGFLAARRRELAAVVRDITTTIRRYRCMPTQSPVRSFGILGSWSVKNADVASDLFSNAVLSSNATNDIALKSDMTLVAMGFITMSSSKTRPTGLYFTHDAGGGGASKAEILQIAYTYNVAEILAARPLLACLLLLNETLDFHRLVLTVYPMNVSPYPRTMTTFPVFNARQVDVYADVYVGDYKPVSFSLAAPPAPLDVFFQPSENPKSYIQVGCATWSDLTADWTDAVCTRGERVVTVADTTSSHAFCHCDLTNRSETRIIMYEYTTLPNFSFVATVDAALIVFLMVAALSLVGYVGIVVTALTFAKWRDELGTKILVHLTVSSSLYLALTTFRETHEIYADSNHDSGGLIAFTVSVHYTRLAHFSWGLVMSVLQYRRFSSVVGAVSVPHLLLKVSLLAWGVPIVPLLVLLLWDRETHFCSPDKMTHLVLYLVPGVVITVFNLGLMVAIVYAITNKCGRGEDANLQRHNVSDADLLKRRLKTITLMFFLFGFPTMFEMFNDIGSHSVVVEYFSKVLDPIQGFVLFLFFIVFDEKMRGQWLVKMGYSEKKAKLTMSSTIRRTTTVRRR